MSILKYFKNIPRSPHRATGPKCNFFSSNSQRGPWQKKGACRLPNGRQGPVAHPRGDRGLSPVGGGDRVPPPYISPGRHPLCHFSLKIQEKREG